MSSTFAASDDPWSNYDPAQAAESLQPELAQGEKQHEGRVTCGAAAASSTEELNGNVQANEGPALGPEAEEDHEAKESGSGQLPNGHAKAHISTAKQQDTRNLDNIEGGVDDDDDDDDEEDAFVYPGAESSTQESITASPLEELSIAADSGARATEEVLTPIAAVPEPDRPASPPARTATPRPIDFQRLAPLSSQGPLSALQSFFEVTCAPAPAGSNVSRFALANETSPMTGLAPVHYAAREGKVDILRWLVEDAGALVDLEDREGETALHKVALKGKLGAMKYLLEKGADARAEDADGWTPLHNACSQGYLDLVKLLLEQGGDSVNPSQHARRGGWTPLMNAASKGHLPIVRYLTAKQGVDPFARNHAGETAYDIAAATFEVYICEILQRYEQERWNALRISASVTTPSMAGESSTREAGTVAPGKGPYNPLSLHQTVTILLHENQRLDTRLQTLAMNGGKPRWSHQSAARPHKPDRRAPGTMPPGPLAPSRTRRHVPVWREDVDLPSRNEPYKLKLNLSKAHAAAGAAARRREQARQRHQQDGGDQLASTPTPESILRRAQESEEGQAAAGAQQNERSHFWLSEWQIDRSHPFVDVQTGWQYAQSFDSPDERWSAEVPPPLERLLQGKGLAASVTRAISGGTTPGPRAVPVPSANANAHGDEEVVATGWVRRRRWVRVMRRRLDIEFGDELEATEVAGLEATAATASSLPVDGVKVTAKLVVGEAQRAARIDADRLGTDADYTARAAAIAGVAVGTTPADAMCGGAGGVADELLRRITRLTLAIEEIRSNAFSDESSKRRGKAEDMLKEYTVQLGQLRQAANFDGDSEDGMSDGVEEGEGNDEEEEEFIYPNSYKDDGASVFTRIAPRGTSSSSAVVTLQVRPSVPQRQSSSAFVLGAVVSPSEAVTSAAALRSADLAASREFRVPTRENSSAAVFMSGAPRLMEQRLQPQWENDSNAKECRGCSRKFTFFLRKHHCRRCGRIFCDSCTSHRAQLSLRELITDPAVPEMILGEQHSLSRVCANCSAELQLPSRLQTPRGADVLLGHSQFSSGEENDADGHPSVVGTPVSDVSSRASELTECPVCSKTLTTLGDSTAQEEHVRTCLENGGGGSVQGDRYLVYKLPENSPIVGKECVICMEDFMVESTIARLPCLCFFHRACIDSWIKRGKACPVHARTW